MVQNCAGVGNFMRVVLGAGVMCCEAIRREDSRRKQENADIDSFRNTVGPFAYAVAYAFIVVISQMLWPRLRDQRINGRMATLKQDMLHARRSAEENNMPETIVRCFKFERHALKTEKEIEQLEREQAATASSLCAVDYILTYLVPILPYFIFGNIELFRLGPSGQLWPMSWALSPSG